MRLYYFKSRDGNFGDDINGWMWHDLLPEVFDDDSNAWMSGIGTIIGEEMPFAKTRVVFSSGAGYSRPPVDFAQDGWRIVSVRGPLSARVLGLSSDCAVTDGAILLASLPEGSPIPEKERSGVVFMPHHKALSYGVWREVCDRAGIEFIDPRDESHQTLERMRRSKLVIADAMHAAIVADTLRVPWVPVVASSEINGFKWLDWALSMEVPYRPLTMPSSSLTEAVTRFALNWGGGLHAKGLSEEMAVESFHKKLKANGDTISFIEKKARLGLAKILRKVVSFIKMFAWGRKLEKAQMNKAVEALSSAVTGNSFLSSDQVFSQRLSEMKYRLKIVEEISEEIKGR